MYLLMYAGTWLIAIICHMIFNTDAPIICFQKKRKKKQKRNTKKGKGKKEIRGKEKMDYPTF